MAEVRGLRAWLVLAPFLMRYFCSFYLVASRKFYVYVRFPFLWWGFCAFLRDCCGVYNFPFFWKKLFDMVTSDCPRPRLFIWYAKGSFGSDMAEEIEIRRAFDCFLRFFCLLRVLVG